MTWLIDPVTREPLPAVPKMDNWPPKPLSIYADLDYERSPRMTEPRDPEPETPDVRNDPIEESVRETDDDASDPTEETP